MTIVPDAARETDETRNINLRAPSAAETHIGRKWEAAADNRNNDWTPHYTVDSLPSSPNTDRFDDTVPVATTHVFFVGGQSNSISRTEFDNGVDWPENVFQVGRAGLPYSSNLDNEIVPAVRPLDHHVQPIDGGMGFALQFAIEYKAANPGVDLVLVPCGLGGTGFVDNRWNPNDDLYADAVQRVNTLMAANPTFTFMGMLWHQGEKDAQQGAAAASAHAGLLDAMIAAMRSDINDATPTTPFVLGGMVPSWVAADADRQTVQSGLTDTPNRVLYSGYASSTGLVDRGDGIHFDAASYRTLGSRYLTALGEAILNDELPPPFVPQFTFDNDATLDDGVVWDETVNTAGVPLTASGGIVTVSATGAVRARLIEAVPNDVFSEIPVFLPSGFGGNVNIGTRLQPNGDGYVAALLSSGELRLFRVQGGVNTLLTSAAVSVLNNAPMRLTSIGSSHTFTYNGVTISANDSTFTAGSVSIGIFNSSLPSAQIDYFDFGAAI